MKQNKTISCRLEIDRETHKKLKFIALSKDISLKELFDLMIKDTVHTKDTQITKDTKVIKVFTQPKEEFELPF